MSLSNTLIYDGLLKCGTPAVAQRTLSLPSLSLLHRPTSTPCPSTCWLTNALTPTSPSALFLNTDSLLPSALELVSGPRITNALESTLLTRLVSSLLTCGLPPSSLGLISIYRSQLALLRHSLRHLPPVEMHTADKFQGRDKEVIILSLVRSNETGHIGDLLKDWRRVNVAITRARSKLIIVGSAATMRKGGGVVGKLVDLMAERGWIVDLPRGADGMHASEGLDTQETTGWEEWRSLTASSDRKGKVDVGAREDDGGVKGKENVPPIPGKTSPVAVSSSSLGKLSSQASLKEKGKMKTKHTPKRGRISDRAILKGRPVLQNILNSLS